MPKKYTVKYVGSVTPKKTKFLTSSPIKMDFEGELELDETDGSKHAAIQKAFQSEMDKQIKNSLKNLDQWLGEKDKLIATMIKQHEAIKKFGFPSTASEAKAIATKNAAVLKIAEDIENFPKDYEKIVKDWAENAREQQGRICLMTALKKARANTLSNKSWRVRAGMAIKITLVVAGIALSIAAIVLTAGATAPIFVGLAAAGLTLSGVSSLSSAGVMFKNNYDTEKKILENVRSDVKKVEAALKPMDGVKTSLAKHVTELRNVMKKRNDDMKQFKSNLQEKKAQIGGYEKLLLELNAEIAKQATPDKKTLAEVASRQKKVIKLKKQVQDIEKKIAKAEQGNREADVLLKDLENMNIQLEKISGQSASTVAGNLKARFTSLEGLAEVSGEVGGLLSGFSGAHA